MLSITLNAHFEDEWLGESPSLRPFLDGRNALYHQWLTYNAESTLIINAYNTGTGKTKAAFLRLLKRAQEKHFQLDESEDNVLLIAPTNELLAQHARDAQDFCANNGLPYRVLSMSRAALDEIQNRPHFSEQVLRPGAALHAIMENPRKADATKGKKATIFVVNPDIFYYAFYFLYHRNDRIPLFQDIFTLCNYIIIDEFHYYNPKQLANFLFFMRLSHEQGFVSGSTKRQFCLLTATPSKEVDEYLQRLSFSIERIDPQAGPDASEGQVQKTAALAPVKLNVYNLDELKGNVQGEADGLIALVDLMRPQIAAWLKAGKHGAIISSSLWRIEQIYNRLKSQFGEQMGRITGPEKREGRNIAARQALILATPTVDIGYNFDKDNKDRQSIDFLFFDARSGDEFIQRLGRAGRVLGKKQQDIPSDVYAVVDPEFYKALQEYDGQTLSRTRLRQLAEDILPKRNDLYAYIASESIGEALLPIYRMQSWYSSAEEDQIRALFDSVCQLFKEKEIPEYRKLISKIRTYLAQEQCYARFEEFSQEKLEILERAIVKKEQHAEVWLQPFLDRLVKEQEYRKSRGKELFAKRQEAYEWILNDMRDYFVKKARFSFREYFQPPLALVNDSKRLYTSDDVAVDDALRIVRYYDATYFGSKTEWEQNVHKVAPDRARDALVFCNLKDLREPGAQLRIGFTLDARNLLRARWEELYAHGLTALYGLEIVALNDSHGLPAEIQYLLGKRFIPALVVAENTRSCVELWRLQRKAQYIPYKLTVTFADKIADYWMVLGTMALQIHAEIPVGILKSDWRRAARDDDVPIII